MATVSTTTTRISWLAKQIENQMMEERTNAKRSSKSALKNKIVNQILASKNFAAQVQKLARQFEDHQARINRILAEKFVKKTETA